MNAKISALMDGELQDSEVAELFHALRDDADALESWRQFHLIGDALRDTEVLSGDFSGRFAARLAEEPTVFAPASIAVRPQRRRHWVALSVAASLSAVSLVAWLAFAPRVTQGPVSAQLARTQVPAASAEAANVPLPSETNAYLLAHQNYSPRNNLQGVAPYVRTVSESARPR